MKIISCVACNKSFDLHRMKDCPACGETYRERSEPAARPFGYEQCEWESNGVRCRYPGSISSSTSGFGKFHCRLHFSCESGSFGEQIVRASQDYQHMSNAEKLDEANAAAREFCGGKVLRKVPTIRSSKPGVEWARAIMARIEAGESLPPLFEKFARDALGLHREAA